MDRPLAGLTWRHAPSDGVAGGNGLVTARPGTWLFARGSESADAEKRAVTDSAGVRTVVATVMAVRLQGHRQLLTRHHARVPRT